MELKATFGKLKDIFQKFSPNALKIGGNSAIAGFLHVFEEMLEKFSPCPCIPDWNAAYTVIVFVVPAVILYMICAFAYPDSQRVLKCEPRIQCGFATKTLLKIGIPSVLWIVIVLLDGDYYTCSKIQTGTRGMCENYCSSNTTRSPELDYYCFKSWMIGAILLTVTVTLLVLFNFLSVWKCDYCTKEDKDAKDKAKEDKAKKDFIADPNQPAVNVGETVAMLDVNPNAPTGH